MNILIADDDPMQRELLAGFLEKQDHRALTAGDGSAALALFQREPVALALLDPARTPGGAHQPGRGLVRYRYPGNVRELKHILQRALTLARGSVLRPVDLPAGVRRGEPLDQGPLQEQLDGVERSLLTAALEASDWVQTRAAERLGISERVSSYKDGQARDQAAGRLRPACAGRGPASPTLG